jgi:predicted dehydrogenase
MPEGFLDYREMLEKVPMDAVVIATPLHEHAQMTIDALNLGIHVFVEKAMARTLDETRAMYDAYLESGKLMFVGHQRLFNPVYSEGDGHDKQRSSWTDHHAERVVDT